MGTVQPETKYAKSGDLHIAYQVIGEGPIDLVFVPSWFGHVDFMWQEPLIERVLARLSSFSRLLVFDQRGTGLSDPVALADLPTLEERMDDIRAVMDAAGSERAAVVGAAEGGPLCALFAASHPDRTAALVLFNTTARFLRDDDYPIGLPRELVFGTIEANRDRWGRPGSADGSDMNNRLKRWLPIFHRMSASPGAATAILRMNYEVDVRGAIGSIRTPTLVIHRTGNPLLRADHGRYLAEHIPGARLLEVPGNDASWFVEDTNPVLDEIQEFLTGVRPGRDPDRVLATVMLTDVRRRPSWATAAGGTRSRRTRLPCAGR